MDNKGAEVPPPYEANAPPQHQYPPSSQPYYPPTSQPQYPPTSQPYYPPTSQPYYPPTSQPQYGPPGGDMGKVPPPGSAPGPSPAYIQAQPQQMTSNTTTVIMAGGVTAPQQQIIRHAPPSYMALSWITCLFCCWPLGIAAIISSSRVDSAISVGNFDEAQRESNKAKGYNIAAIICGIIIIVIIVIRFTVLVSTYDNNYYYNK